MSGTPLRSMWFGLHALLCASCVHAGAQRTVILAGSVCSGSAPLTAATEASAAPRDQALVAYVTPEPKSELVVYDIRAGRARFHVPVTLRNRPQLLTDVVAGVDDEHRLVAYDLQTGQLRAAQPVPRANWLGAVQVGRVLVSTSSSMSFRPAERGSTVTALDTRSGAVLWQRDVPYALSRPSAAAGRVFVVSDHADVWALDPDSGASVGCARLGDEPIEWLSPRATKLVLGTQDARDVELTGAAPSDGGRLQLPIAELPGQPLLQPSGYRSVPADRSAYGRVGVVTTLDASSQRPALLGGRYYFVFYKHLFAYGPDGRLHWAHKLDADSVQLRALKQALLVLTESGELLWLRAQDGSTAARLQLPDHVTSADVTATRVPAGLTSQPAAPADLRAQLRALALDTDARLVPSRRLAVTALARLVDPEATRDLLEVYEQPSAPAELRKHIAKTLARRRTGSQFLIEALARDYDFLTGEEAPPLAAIVPGLVTNNEVGAVPRLVDRLFDPDTRLSELNLLVDAIAKLAGDTGDKAHKPLAEFFALYHADSSLNEDVSSLLSAASVLWTGTSATDVALVEAASKDPSTLDAVRAGLVPLMASATPKVRAESAVAAAQPEAEPEEPPAVVPERLSDAAISRAFANHASDLRECVAAELARNASLRALRFSLVVEHSGAISRFSVWPQRPELLKCLQPKLEAMRFPKFARGRRLANYTLALRQGAVRAQAELTDGDGSKPFWFTAQLRAVGSPAVADRTPWWQDQNPLYVSVEEPAERAVPTDAKVAPSSSSASIAPVSSGDTNADGRASTPHKASTRDGAAPTGTHAPQQADTPTGSNEWWLPATDPKNP